MKKYIVVVLLLVLLPINYAYSADIPCTKRQVGQIKNTMTCTKISKYRYAWKIILPKNEVINKEIPSTEIKKVEQEYDLCGIDNHVPSEWSELQNWFLSNNMYCNSVYRIVEKNQYSEKPKINLTKNNINVDQCKIKQNPLKSNTIAFPTEDKMTWWNNSLHPSPNTVYQVIPIYSKDSGVPTESPSDTYGKYFKFIENWTKYSSDNGSNVKFKIYDKYIEIPEYFKDYNIKHERSSQDAIKINNLFKKYVDKYIDFSGSNVAIFIVPPSTDLKLVEQVGLGRINTDEGQLISVIFPPSNLKENLGYNYMKFITPSWWLHQMIHVGIGFDDNLQQHEDGTNYWGLINGASAGDLLGWQKWLAGFISDSQVLCFDIKQNFTSWVIPSNYKIKENKLIVLKVSNSKVIVLESIRPYGLNYKVNKNSTGVRAYVVDTSITKSQDGIRVLKPSNRKLNNNPYLNADAALRVGDFILYNNKKISIVESGDFGDIIKLEDIGL